MYAPPETLEACNAGMTSRYDRSFEIRLSVSKSPPSSESRSMREANDWVVGCAIPYSARERKTAASNAELAAYRTAGLIGSRNRIIVLYAMRMLVAQVDLSAIPWHRRLETRV